MNLCSQNSGLETRNIPQRPKTDKGREWLWKNHVFMITWKKNIPAGFLKFGLLIKNLFPTFLSKKIPQTFSWMTWRGQHECPIFHCTMTLTLFSRMSVRKSCHLIHRGRTWFSAEMGSLLLVGNLSLCFVQKITWAKRDTFDILYLIIQFLPKL